MAPLGLSALSRVALVCALQAGVNLCSLEPSSLAAVKKRPAARVAWAKTKKRRHRRTSSFDSYSDTSSWTSSSSSSSSFSAAGAAAAAARNQDDNGDDDVMEDPGLISLGVLAHSAVTGAKSWLWQTNGDKRLVAAKVAAPVRRGPKSKSKPPPPPPPPATNNNKKKTRKRGANVSRDGPVFLAADIALKLQAPPEPPPSDVAQLPERRAKRAAALAAAAWVEDEPESPAAPSKRRRTHVASSGEEAESQPPSVDPLEAPNKMPLVSAAPVPALSRPMVAAAATTTTAAAPTTVDDDDDDDAATRKQPQRDFKPIKCKVATCHNLMCKTSTSYCEEHVGSVLICVTPNCLRAAETAGQLCRLHSQPERVVASHKPTAKSVLEGNPQPKPSRVCIFDECAATQRGATPFCIKHGGGAFFRAR